MTVWDRLRRAGSRETGSTARPLELLPHALFQATIVGELDRRLTEAGFVEAGKRRWAKAWAPDLIALIELEPLKAAFTAAWGVSLPFVPHLTDSYMLGWHRTLKAARFDLSFHPRDYEEERSAWVLSQFATREELAGEAPAFASQVVAHALAFLAPLSQVEALPAAFEEKRDRPSFGLGLQNYRQELLAYAFVLARCGRKPEAEERLRVFWARIRELDAEHRLRPETEEELNRLFTQAVRA